MAIAALACGLFATTAHADPAALPGETAVADGPVFAIAQAPDRTYLGGAFTHIGPRTGHGVQLGAADHLLRPGMPEVAGGAILAVAADGGGGWFIGGSFTSVADQPRARLAHILPDGTLDAWDPEPDGQVETLAVAETAGARILYVGGAFNRIRVTAGQSPVARAKLAAFALPSAGGAVGAGLRWNPGISSSTPGTFTDVLSIGVLDVSPDVSGVPTEMPLVFVAGSFDRAGSQGTAAGGLAALWGPGAQDPTGAPPADGLAANLAGGSTISGTMRALAVGASAETTLATARDSYATLYVASDSPGAKPTDPPTGTLRALRIKLIERPAPSETADAVTASSYTNDWTATPACTSTCGAVVRTIVTSVVPAGNGTSTTTVYAGGNFSQALGTAAQGVAALQGVADPTGNGNAAALVPGFGNPGMTGVQALSLAGGRLYAGGSFDSVRHAPLRRLAALDAASGDPVAGWDGALAGGDVDAVAATDSGVYAGGTFTSANAVERDGLAAIDASGRPVAGWSPAVDGPVQALALDGDALLVGGQFANIAGVSRTGLAAVTVADGTPTGWDPHPASSCSGSGCTAPPAGVLALAAAPGGPVYVGGQFTSIGGATRHDIAAVDPVSGQATGWAPEADGAVQALLPACGAVYVGGSFTHVAGAARSKLGALDPATGSALPFDPEADSAVYALALGHGVLYAGGQFSQIGGTSRGRLAALDPSTGEAAGFSPTPDGTIYAVGYAGGQVIAGGRFGHVGPDVRRDLAAIDPETGVATPWQPNPDDEVRAIATTASDLDIGGWFGQMGTRGQQGFASFAVDGSAEGPACPPPPAPPADTTPAPPPPPPPDEPPADVAPSSYTPPAQPAPRHYPPPRDTTPPVLSDVFATGHRILLGRRTVTIGFTLSEAGKLHVRIDRHELMPCPVKLTSHGPLRRYGCHRYTRRGGFTRRAGAGEGRFSLDGAGLAPGRYRATIVATDAAGNYSRAVRIGLLVLR